MAGLVFSSVDEVTQLLEYTIGRLFKEVTQREIIIDEGATIPKQEGNYALLTQMVLNPLTWSNNEIQDEDGLVYHTRNFTVSYNLTTIKGRTCSADLSKFLQCIQLPFYREKYFASPCPYAYSDCSSINKYRIPTHAQSYEDRANVLLTFNICYAEMDGGILENIESVRVYTSTTEFNHNEKEIDSIADIDISEN